MECKEYDLMEGGGLENLCQSSEWTNFDVQRTGNNDRFLLVLLLQTFFENRLNFFALASRIMKEVGVDFIEAFVLELVYSGISRGSRRLEVRNFIKDAFETNIFYHPFRYAFADVCKSTCTSRQSVDQLSTYGVSHRKLTSIPRLAETGNKNVQEFLDHVGYLWSVVYGGVLRACKPWDKLETVQHCGKDKPRIKDNEGRLDEEDILVVTKLS